MSIKSYVSKEPESRLLKDGESVVALRSCLECTSADEVRYQEGQLIIAGQKPVKKLWATPTSQIAILVGNADGVLLHRLNEGSHLHWDAPEFTAEMRNSGLYTEVEGYVCSMQNGKLDRIPNPKGLETCDRIISGFLHAITDRDGVPGDVAVDEAIAGKKLFTVVVKSEVWNGTIQKSISGFRRLKDSTPAVTGNDDEEDMSS
jgi:hypothetical protein